MAGISSHTQKFVTSLIDLHQDCVRQSMIIYSTETINKCITEIQEDPGMYWLSHRPPSKEISAMFEEDHAVQECSHKF